MPCSITVRFVDGREPVSSTTVRGALTAAGASQVEIANGRNRWAKLLSTPTPRIRASACNRARNSIRRCRRRRMPFR